MMCIGDRELKQLDTRMIRLKYYKQVWKTIALYQAGVMRKV